MARPHPEPSSERIHKHPPRRRYHFHTPGVLYVAVTLFVAVGAINSQNNLLFSALGLAIGGLLVSGILSGASLVGIRLERLPPLPSQGGSVGAPLAIRYAITNTNRLFPAFGLHIDELPSAGEPERSWTRSLAHLRGFLIHAGPRRTVEARSQAVPRRRGPVHVEAVRVWSTFPFGLAKKSVTFYIPQTVLVYPPQLPLRPGLVARLASRSDHGLGGERDVGLGDEFYGLREYTAGDNPRRIAWKRSARTGDLVVRQHAAPTPQKLWVVLDLDPPPSAGSGAAAAAQERAIALASAILREASLAGVTVGLAIPAARVLISLRPGRWHLERLQAQLAMLELADLHESAGASLPQSAARSGACVVVHAGPGTSGPPGARHLGAAQAEQYLASTDSAAALLALMGDPGPAPEPAIRPPMSARLRSALGLARERAA